LSYSDRKINKQVVALEQQGKSELAQKYRENIENYKKLENKITDSGMTTEQAIRYRLNPEWETIIDITDVSHQAGSEGAKFGAMIGGSISLVSNIIAVYSNQKEFSEAAIDTARDTLVAAGGLWYSTRYSNKNLYATISVSNLTFFICNRITCKYYDNLFSHRKIYYSLC
jgi:hypothetical protein